MCAGSCIRQAGWGRWFPDLVLTPVTRDEVGQYGSILYRTEEVTLEACADGTRLWHVVRPLVLRHPVEEDVLVPPGLYRLKWDNNWAGAPRGEPHAE